MADYNANIRVSADTTGAERAINRLSKRIESLDLAAVLVKQADQLQQKVKAVSIPLKLVGIEDAVRGLGALQSALTSVQRRGYTIRVNDSQVQAASLRVKTLNTQLEQLAKKKITVDVEIAERRTGSQGRPISEQEIARRAREARAGGLSARAAEILGGERRAESAQTIRNQLLQRLGRRNLESNGYNVPGLKQIISSLAPDITPSGKRSDLVAQAKKLVETVNDDIINELGKNLLDLRMQLQPIRGQAAGGPQRSTPNFDDIVGQMAAATTRPYTAARLLKQLPERYITTDLANQASKQRFYYDNIPLAAEMQAASGRFDPLLKSIAEAFAKYTRSLTTFNPWVGGPPGSGLSRLWQTRPSSGLLALPAAGGSSSQRMTNSAFAGLPAITAPRLGAAEDERYLRSISRSLKEANDTLNGIVADYSAVEAEVNRQKSLARQVSEAMIQSRQRILPPAGGTGGGRGGALATIPNLVEDTSRYGRGIWAIQDEAERRAVRNRLRRAQIAQGRSQQSQNAAGYENLALGVGFPLLFGGGPGSILGATAGSFVGSGFGGQILGGAIGQALDQFAQAATELGAALNSPTDAFGVLKERALISSRELEKLGDKLQEAGFAASASALAQEDINNRLGVNGVRNLQALASASDDFNRAIAALSAQMQAALAGPLGGFVRGAARLAERGALRGSGESIRSSLSGANQANFDRDISRAIEGVVAQRFGVKGTNSRGPISSINYLSNLDPEKLQQILDKYGPLQVGIAIKLTREQVRQELTTTLTKQLEAIDLSRGITQQVRERARAQEDLDLQRADMVMQQERAIGDLRRSIEDRIVDIRLTNLQRENELLDTQAQIRLQSLKNSNVDLRNGFTNDQVSGAANAVANYLEAELQVANDAAKIKRDTALEVQRLDIENERFKIQTAIQVSRLNQDTAKQVASIQRNVLRQNQDQDNRRFALEKELAKLRLQGLATEFALLAQQGQAAQRSDIATLAKESLKRTSQGVSELEALKAPAALRFNASGLGGVGVSTGGVDAANAQAKQLILNLEAAKQGLLDLVRAGNFRELQASLENTFNKPLQKAKDEADAFWEAVNGAGIGAVSNEQSQKNSALSSLLTQLDELKAKSKDPQVQALLQGYIDVLPSNTQATDQAVTTSELLKTLQEDFLNLQDRYEALKTPAGELTKTQQVYNELVRNNIPLESARAQALLQVAGAYDQMNAKITEQERSQQALNELYSGISSELVNGVSRGLDLVADSTKNVGEAMRGLASDILQTIGKMLIFQGLAQLFGGVLGGGSANPQGIFSFIGKAFGYKAAEGAYWPGGFQAFANGGMVTRPTMGLVGEGGEPEYIIPASKMRGAMARYASGARGSAVIPGNGESGGAGMGATPSGTIDVRYSIERINNVDYVTAEQFQRGMAQAAQQGAIQGERRAMRTLQNSTATRRRISV